MELLERIKGKLKDITTLDIVTAVGKPQVGSDGRLVVDFERQAVMFTQIHLLESDITTSMDEAFVSGEYRELRSFHQERVTEGMKSVRDKIAALKELYQLGTALERASHEPKK